MKRWHEVGYKPKTNPYRLRDDSTSEQDLDTFQRMSVIADALAAESRVIMRDVPILAGHLPCGYGAKSWQGRRPTPRPGG